MKANVGDWLVIKGTTTERSDQRGHDRLLRPLLAADQPPAPSPLRKALHTIDTHITERIDNAGLPLKAA
jgi:hypothetical protein